MTKKMRDYASIEWNKYFDLSAESPSGLVWKEGMGKPGNKGGVAGARCYDCRSKKPGSWQVKLSGVHWLVHRVILVMRNIDILGKVIDHIDGNPFNNVISNLSITTQESNCQNQRMPITNTSGVVGVGIKINKSRSYFGASCWSNKTRKTKYFSIDDFGYDKAFEMACEHRKFMLEQLNKEGANYSDRHGL